MKDVYEVFKRKRNHSACAAAQGRRIHPCTGIWRKIFVLFRLRPGSGRTGKCDWKIGKRFESGGRAEGSL